MPFEADWRGDGRSFEWRARAGRPFRPLRVVDHYAQGDGGMDVRLFGRITLVHARGEDTARSAAGRAAVEAAIWAPRACSHRVESSGTRRATTTSSLCGRCPRSDPKSKLRSAAPGPFAASA
jgi:hypothetical protein